MIIGCSGAGKSVFARKLRDKTGLPLYYLDQIWHKPDKTNITREEFDARLSEIVQKERWIIDGNYGSSMEMRLKECDTVFFLDYPTEVCIEGIETRKGKPRSDMPWIENDNTDDDFISFINNYNSESRPEVIKLLEKYSSKNIIVFHSREESEKYLVSL